jgi:hypothetical protein
LVRALERRFQGFTLKHIPRAKNSEADELAKAAANNLPMPVGTFYQVLTSPTTKIAAKTFQIVLLIECEDWRQSIIDALNNISNPEDKANATRMTTRVRSYTMIKGTLYKKGVLQPLLKCILQNEGKELLLEIHSGICGSHIGPRALSTKAIKQGFYWPTHIKDAEHIVKTCEACQNFSPHQSRPSVETQLILPTWPLQRWGIYLVGSLPPSQGGNKFAVVAIEYFTRWIKAKPLATITSKSVKKFFWQNIVCRFGVPRSLTVDNGKQFDSENFKNFKHRHKNNLHFSLPSRIKWSSRNSK